MARAEAGTEEDGKKAKSKAKRSGPSLLQLEREKYTKGAAASRKGKKEDLDLGDALAGFRAKLFAATKEEAGSAGQGDEAKDPTLYGILMDDDDDDDVSLVIVKLSLLAMLVS